MYTTRITFRWAMLTFPFVLPEPFVEQFKTIQNSNIQLMDIKIFCTVLESLAQVTGIHHTIQYNTIQYNTIQYNTIQYNTIQYNTIQYNTIQYNTIQYNNLYLYSN